jgi:hypothetical protein
MPVGAIATAQGRFVGIISHGSGKEHPGSLAEGN